MELTPGNNVNGTIGGDAYHEKNSFSNGNCSKQMSYLSKLSAVDIEFNDITYSMPSSRKESKMILKGVSGQFKSGELTAILGPSGAGKTTLLNILAGLNYTNVGGSIHVQGQPRNMQQFKKLSSYIMQNDLVQLHLTVLESMRFATELKLGKTKSLSEKQNAIEDILTTLRMYEARDTLTDHLSGGQKKRLVVALELVHNPPIIFFDEPTTGLDDLASSQCIDLLQNLAHFGRTVVCSIHTPSASTFKKFDHVYVMAAGKCIYRGGTNEVTTFLQNRGIECPKHYNPADFLIEIASGDYGFDITERIIAYVEKLPIVSTFRSKHEFEFDKKLLKVSWFHQFSTLLRRKLLQTYRNKNCLHLQLLLQIILGLMVCTLYFNIGNDASLTLFNFGFCFVSLIICLYIPMLPVLMYFPIEIQLIKREYFNRWYRLSAYYWALTVINIPSQIVLTLAYFLLAYFVTGQPLELYRCCMFFGTCFLCSCIAETIGYNLASIFNVSNSIFIGPTMSAPLMLLAIQSFGQSTPLPLFQKIFMYSSYIRYGLEALMVSVYGYGRKKMICPSEEIYCYFNSPGEVFTHILGTGTSPNFWIDISMLVVILVFSKACFYYLLSQRLQPNKTFQMIYLIGKLIKQYFNM